MESLKYVHNFPQNHLRVLRRTDLRKCPKTYLPARVHRDVPKHPKIENITISLYPQQNSLETRPKRNLPMRSFGGLWKPFGPQGTTREPKGPQGRPKDPLRDPRGTPQGTPKGNPITTQRSFPSRPYVSEPPVASAGFAPSRPPKSSARSPRNPKASHNQTPWVRSYASPSPILDPYSLCS